MNYGKKERGPWEDNALCIHWKTSSPIAKKINAINTSGTTYKPFLRIVLSIINANSQCKSFSRPISKQEFRLCFIIYIYIYTSFQ